MEPMQKIVISAYILSLGICMFMIGNYFKSKRKK